MENKEYHEMIPIWFFIGLMLAFYGLLIMGAGIYQIFFRLNKNSPCIIFIRVFGGVGLCFCSVYFIL
jgi:hypothetical protein